LRTDFTSSVKQSKDYFSILRINPIFTETEKATARKPHPAAGAGHSKPGCQPRGANAPLLRDDIGSANEEPDTPSKDGPATFLLMINWPGVAGAIAIE
jgi:hypothetical protein